jgi:outer membrane protein assembly factor BamB
MTRPLLLSLLIALAAAEDWSRFRGPNGSGVATDAAYPVEFSRSKRIAWRTPVRPGKSSPVLTKRHIFVAAFEAEKLYVQCFDRQTGKLLWERAHERPRNEVKNRLNEPATATPIADGDFVHAFFSDYGLISYDSAGNLRWKTPLGPFTNIQGVAVSPILAGDNIILVIDQQDDPFVAAFDRRNGETRWKRGREEKDAWSTPVLYRPPGAAPQIITVGRGLLGAHDSRTGARLWSYDQLSPAIVSSPIVIGDVVYTFGYGNESPNPFAPRLARHDRNKDGKLSPDEYGDDAFLIGVGRFEGNRDGIIEQEEWDAKQQTLLVPSRLLAVKLEADGKGGVRPRELWRYEKSFVGVIPSILHYQGVLYLIRNGGLLTSFDAANGTVAKMARLDGALGGYSASPVAADGKVYLAGEEGKVVVLRAGREWEILAVNDFGESFFATPALSGGQIYLRSSDALYRVQ